MLIFAASTSPLSYANAMRVGQAFKTRGNLSAKIGFGGLGKYVPFDKAGLDEISNAVYVVYSFETPIAWRTKEGAWVKNMNYYSVTTSKHQSKIFAAIRELF